MIPMISRTSRIRPRQIRAPQNQGLLFLFAFFAFSSSSSERRLSTGVWRRLFMLAKLAWKFQSHRREGQLCFQFAAECSVRVSVCTSHLQSTSNTVGQVHRNCLLRPVAASSPSLMLVAVVGEDQPSLGNVAHLASRASERLLLAHSSQGKPKVLLVDSL